MAKPVVVTLSGGKPVVNTPTGQPATPVTDGGIPITLVDAFGMPMALINEDGTAWSDAPSEPSADFSQAGNSQYFHMIFED